MLRLTQWAKFSQVPMTIYSDITDWNATGGAKWYLPTSLLKKTLRDYPLVPGVIMTTRCRSATVPDLMAEFVRFGNENHWTRRGQGGSNKHGRLDGTRS